MWISLAQCWFPPHTRGWTDYWNARKTDPQVSPAHAGMDRGTRSGARWWASFPRTRGDGPGKPAVLDPERGFPPHTRGWTGYRKTPLPGSLVSPAHAGMDPRSGSRTAAVQSFPRTRGDGPLVQPTDGPAVTFPPHTRGWTLSG